MSKNFNQVLSGRSSLNQKLMDGSKVLRSHLQSALASVASVPVHGRGTPYHYVIFTHGRLQQARNILYPLKSDKYTREVFDDIYKGVGAFIFAFCKILPTPIPTYEHEWSTACGMYAIQLSLSNFGYATMWNSIFKDCPHVKTILEACAMEEPSIPMGYLMVGGGKVKKKPRAVTDAYTTWNV